MLDLITGLNILMGYVGAEEPPVVTFAYGVTIPRIKAASLSSQDQTDIELAGWTVHPVYQSYWYELDTLTELADITGPEEVRIDIPAIPYDVL